MTAAHLIDVIAEAMRLKARWSEADRAALRRWVSGASPRRDIKERLARLVADGALRRTVVSGLDDLRRRRFVDALEVGLLEAAQRCERGPSDVWYAGVVATTGVILKYLDEHALVLSHGGAAAQAPDWVLTSSADGRPRNLVAQRVLDVLKHADDDDGDGRLRKNAAALLKGSSPQRDTIDEFQEVMTRSAEKAGREPPQLVASLALHEIMQQLGIGLVEKILLLSQIEAFRNHVGEVDDDMLLDALEGRVFEAVEMLWARRHAGS